MINNDIITINFCCLLKVIKNTMVALNRTVLTQGSTKDRRGEQTELRNMWESADIYLRRLFKTSARPHTGPSALAPGGQHTPWSSPTHTQQRL